MTTHSLIFCSECGTLLDTPSGLEANISCNACGLEHPSNVFDNVKVITSSLPGTFQARATKQEKMEKAKEAAKEQRAVIKEKCPKCGNPEMTFFTMQLRSADEGSTVFYECRKCGNRERVNN